MTIQLIGPIWILLFSTKGIRESKDEKKQLRCFFIFSTHTLWWKQINNKNTTTDVREFVLASQIHLTLCICLQIEMTPLQRNKSKYCDMIFYHWVQKEKKRTKYVCVSTHKRHPSAFRYLYTKIEVWFFFLLAFDWRKKDSLEQMRWLTNSNQINNRLRNVNKLRFERIH